MKVVFILPALFLAISLFACEQLPTTPPALPPGLEEAILPDVPLEGFLYFNQGETLGISGKFFALPQKVGVASAWGWFNFSGQTYGGLLSLSSPGEVEQGAKLLEQSLGKDVGILPQGNNLALIYGGDKEAWLQSVKDGKTATVAGKFPEVWKTMTRLPDKPPGKPIGAGFTLVTREAIDGLIATTQNPEIERYLRPLVQGTIKHFAIGVYAKGSISIEDTLSETYIRDKGLSVLLVVKSTLPGPLVSLIFGSIGAGLTQQEIDLDGGKASYISSAGVHTLIREKGGYIYLSLGPTLDDAKALLTSALSR